MAVVAANVLLALVNAWVLAYAGIFVLGFGGARWTSDIAINYFRSVAGIALKLMTITLLVGIAMSIIDGYHADLATDSFPGCQAGLRNRPACFERLSTC